MALLFLLVLTCAAIYAGDTGLDRVEQAQALQCARASDGTDAAIVQCYTDRDQPVPEDMK